MFIHLALLFLKSSVVVRRHDDTCLIKRRSIKYQEIGRKNINQFLANTVIQNNT